MGRDLQLRLIVTHLAVSLVALILVGVTFAVVLNAKVSNAHESDLRVETTALAQHLNRALASNVSTNGLQNLIRDNSRLMGKRIVLLDSAGYIRYDSRTWTPFSTGKWRTADLKALGLGHGASVAQGINLGYQAPLRVNRRIVGAVALMIAAPDGQNAWTAIVPLLLMVLGGLIVVWVVVGAYFARSLTRPLRQVSRALTVVGDGRYDQPIPEEGWSEARELARRYNAMVVEVARSHQTLRDFMAGAAHELKTPVALLSGYARALEDGTAARGGAVEDAVRTIRVEGEHLARIVDQLFALASLDADAEALTPRTCRPDLLADEIGARLRLRALNQGTSFHIDVPEALPTCVWDADRVQSALTNLVENALDYTGAGDTVSLRGRPVAGEIVFEVVDTGSGIPPDDLPHLFDRFYRGRDSVRQNGHAGLGLALVAEVVRRHGGTVEVRSRVGEGSMFTVMLPRRASGATRVPTGELVPA